MSGIDKIQTKEDKELATVEQQEILLDFVKKLVDEYPTGDSNAIKIFNFYKEYSNDLINNKKEEE